MSDLKLKNGVTVDLRDSAAEFGRSLSNATAVVIVVITDDDHAHLGSAGNGYALHDREVAFVLRNVSELITTGKLVNGN